MINEDKQVVCDFDSIILNDGMTIYPGYLEISKEGSKAHYSNDPNNFSKKFGVLKNRVKGDAGENLVDQLPVDVGFESKKTLHFCDKKCVDQYVEINQ